jgi:diguanylate cyclase (GGDEF)-like protein
LQSGAVDGLRMSTAQGIAGWVARNRQALLLPDASRDPRYNVGMEAETRFRSRSMICVPVVCKDRLLGVIQVINRVGGGSFDQEEFRLVRVLADHAAIAIENASLYRQAEVAALTDDLTGLANTRHLNQVLPDMIARGQRLALLVLDFDNFKQIVDRHGHLIGSQTIAQIGKRIGRVIRPGDFAARFGGDEFVVILPDTPIAEALRVAETLCAEIANFRRLDGHEIDISQVTASIGVAAFPDSASDADGLLHAADAAMYAVKRRGKNGVALAERGMTMSA